MKPGPFGASGRFYRGNLHTHCTSSDGALPMEQAIEAYRYAGYDFLSLTDHFLERYDFPITDTTYCQDSSFATILGAELHAPSLENGEAWHILANGLPLDFAPTRPDETGVELAARAVKAGAFVTIAHPAWYGLTLGDARSLAGAHAVEVYNHSCALETDRGDGWYILDALSSEGRRLSAIATDDAHFKAPDAFGGWVCVKAETLRSDSLLLALKAGDFYASQGPKIFDLSIGAASIEVVCSPAQVVTAVGCGAAAVHKIGSNLTNVSLPRERLKRSLAKLAEPAAVWINQQDIELDETLACDQSPIRHVQRRNCDRETGQRIISGNNPQIYVRRNVSRLNSPEARL